VGETGNIVEDFEDVIIYSVDRDKPIATIMKEYMQGYFILAIKTINKISYYAIKYHIL
jgi:hypothetical protein